MSERLATYGPASAVLITDPAGKNRFMTQSGMRGGGLEIGFREDVVKQTVRVVIVATDEYGQRVLAGWVRAADYAEHNRHAITCTANRPNGYVGRCDCGVGWTV